MNRKISFISIGIIFILIIGMFGLFVQSVAAEEIDISDFCEGNCYDEVIEITYGDELADGFESSSSSTGTYGANLRYLNIYTIEDFNGLSYLNGYMHYNDGTIFDYTFPNADTDPFYDETTVTLKIGSDEIGSGVIGYVGNKNEEQTAWIYLIYYLQLTEFNPAGYTGSQQLELFYDFDGSYLNVFSPSAHCSLTEDKPIGFYFLSTPTPAKYICYYSSNPGFHEYNWLIDQTFENTLYMSSQTNPKSIEIDKSPSGTTHISLVDIDVGDFNFYSDGTTNEYNVDLNIPAIYGTPVNVSIMSSLGMYFNGTFYTGSTGSSEIECEISLDNLVTQEWTNATLSCSDNFSYGNIEITYDDTGYRYGYDVELDNTEVTERFYPTMAGTYKVFSEVEYNGEDYTFTEYFEIEEYGDGLIELTIYYVDGNAESLQLIDETITTDVYYTDGDETITDEEITNGILTIDVIPGAEISLNGESDSYTSGLGVEITPYVPYMYKVPMYPKDTPINESNTYLQFKVWDSYDTPISNAKVECNGETLYTSSGGFVQFEVPHNDTYEYTVSRDRYYSKSGEVTIATEEIYTLNVILIYHGELPTPTPTPTPTPITPTPTPTPTPIPEDEKNPLDRLVDIFLLYNFSLEYAQLFVGCIFVFAGMALGYGKSRNVYGTIVGSFIGFLFSTVIGFFPIWLLISMVFVSGALIAVYVFIKRS